MAKTKIAFKVGRKNYRVEADWLSWKLKRERQAEDETAEVEGDWTIVGYYTKFEQIASTVYDLGLRDSGATSFAELLQVAEGLRSEVRSAFSLWENS